MSLFEFLKGVWNGTPSLLSIDVLIAKWVCEGYLISVSLKFISYKLVRKIESDRNTEENSDSGRDKEKEREKEGRGRRIGRKRRVRKRETDRGVGGKW